MNITQKYRDRASEAAARGLFCVWIEETGIILHKSPGPSPLLMKKRAWRRHEKEGVAMT